MNNFSHYFRKPPTRTSSEQREALLAAFEGSGMSAAAFARQHGVRYGTFCSWMSKHRGVPASPAFVEVEMPGPRADGRLLIEVGEQTRLLVGSEAEAGLAACVLAKLIQSGVC